jgi:anti-sigma factor ChrR (cupin superfamily)
MNDERLVLAFVGDSISDHQHLGLEQRQKAIWSPTMNDERLVVAFVGDSISDHQHLGLEQRQ